MIAGVYHQPLLVFAVSTISNDHHAVMGNQNKVLAVMDVHVLTQ